MLYLFDIYNLIYVLLINIWNKGITKFKHRLAGVGLVNRVGDTSIIAKVDVVGDIGNATLKVVLLHF